MCGCDRSSGYVCSYHQRQSEAVKRAIAKAERRMCEPEKPPVPDYIARIRAGQD